MTKLFFPGMPFTPPVVNGYPFTPVEGREPFWFAEVKDEHLALFGVPDPGSPYLLELPALPEEEKKEAPKVPSADPKEALLAEADAAPNKGALAAWAKEVLGLDVSPEMKREEMMEVVKTAVAAKE
jgi:hypothetical protein